MLYSFATLYVVESCREAFKIEAVRVLLKNLIYPEMNIFTATTLYTLKLLYSKSLNCALYQKVAIRGKSNVQLFTKLH